MEEIKVTMKQNGLKMESNKEDVAMAVKTFRLRKGWTQEQLARHWVCSRYTIIRIEKAKNLSWEMAYKTFARLSEDLRKEKSSEE
jgi:DNA-binding XRE family transcriptional regulator